MRRFTVLVLGTLAMTGIVMLGVAGTAGARSSMPSVSSVSPDHGPTAGGTLVTIDGSNLFGATSVTFGSASASFVNRSNDRLQVLAPPGTAGPPVDVEVTTGVGTSAPHSADFFTYVTTPAIQGVSPRIGATRGGNIVSISGSDFVGVTGVMFGSDPATSYNVVSPNAITAVSPAEAKGTVAVSVTAADGTTPVDPADQYTYTLRVPVVSSVVFDVGNQAGGDVVTITGTGFSKDATVFFGTVPAIATYVSPTTITATSPTGTGVVDVTVDTVKGASVINEPMDEYMYTASGP